MYGYLPDPMNVDAHRSANGFRQYMWFVMWPSIAVAVGSMMFAWWDALAPVETPGDLLRRIVLFVVFAVSVFLVLEMLATVLVARVFMGKHLNAGTIRKIDYRIRSLKVRWEGDVLVPVTDAERFELQRRQDKHLERMCKEGSYRNR